MRFWELKKVEGEIEKKLGLLRVTHHGITIFCDEILYDDTGHYFLMKKGQGLICALNRDSEVIRGLERV